MSFGSNEYSWTSKIAKETEKLKKQLRRLNEIAEKKIEKLEKEVADKARLYKEVDVLLNSLKSKGKLTNSDIENAASDFQNLLWKHRDLIWLNNVPNHPAKVLHPGIALKKALAYNFIEVEQLGIVDDENGNFETAGIIDQKDRIVLISNNFDKNTQNFTAAHELGHALLHKQTILHRDRPINGSSDNFNKSITERQADKFASNFLMPSKLVKNEFIEMFQTDKFNINELTAFNLIKDSPSKLRKDCKNLRGLAIKLASSERYNNQSFLSIAELFNVSITAMAIRLEELELVEF